MELSLVKSPGTPSKKKKKNTPYVLEIRTESVFDAVPAVLVVLRHALDGAVLPPVPRQAAVLEGLASALADGLAGRRGEVGNGAAQDVDKVAGARRGVRPQVARGVPRPPRQLVHQLPLGPRPVAHPQREEQPVPQLLRVQCRQRRPPGRVPRREEEPERVDGGVASLAVCQRTQVSLLDQLKIWT